MENLPKDKKIILFDGICNLCDTSVKLIIKHDKNDVFRFASLQSNIGQEIINHIGVDISKIDSIILYEPGIAYFYKAQAAIRIANELGGVYHFLSLFSILPNSILNFGYDYIAKNRYKWYGKKEQCLIPTTEQKAKFLE